MEDPYNQRVSVSCPYYQHSSYRYDCLSKYSYRGCVYFRYPLSLLPLQIYSTNFTDANPVINLPKTFSRNLRCVSGNSVSSPSFVDNGDGTVTDQNTNLVWQQCPAGVTGGTCTIGMANTLRLLC
ncbi:conserved hypothetical protein [Leptospira interrogans serovar Manilae]|uniref:Uncharacterized protein n=1 Tax=Leptospira interrogans serovar Manilae TaxID=214675 RepID=A0AAQ1SQ84_LEPIR|nr:conserved hypothetical protein [Leptospira interrogans serovar Manilae]